MSDLPLFLVAASVGLAIWYSVKQNPLVISLSVILLGVVYVAARYVH